MSSKTILKSTIKSESDCISLKKYLKKTYNLSFISIQTLIRKNQIKIGKSNEYFQSDRKDLLTYNLKQGDEVLVYQFNTDIDTDKDKENQVKTEISNRKQVFFNENQSNLNRLYENMLLYETKDFIILNKPSGVSCQSGSKLMFSLDEILHQYYSNPTEKSMSSINKDKSSSITPKLIHRIDKSVNGLMIIGKSDEYVSRIGKSMKEKKGEIEKVYFIITQDYPLVFSLIMNKINNTKNLKSKNKYKSLLVTIFNQPIKIFSVEDYSKYILIVNEEYVFISENYEFTSIISKYGNTCLEEIYKKISVEYSVIGEILVESIIYNGKKLVNSENINQVISNSELYIFNNDANGIGITDNYSILKYRLTTGRKHQIRKHCSICLLSPILLDNMYLYDKSKSLILEEIRNIERSSSIPTIKKNVDNGIDESEFLSKYHISAYDHMIFLSSISISLYDSLLYDYNLNSLYKNKKYRNIYDKVRVDNEQINDENGSLMYKNTFKLRKLPVLMEMFLQKVNLKY